MSAQPLRGYQIRALAEARAEYRAGRRSVVIVMPTGSGKTRVGVEIVNGALSRGGRALWLAHREELLEQARERIIGEGISRVGMVSPAYSRDPDATVQIASVPTLVAMHQRGSALPPATVVVFDECHHAPATAQREVIRTYDGRAILGLTATPERADGIALGDVFDALVAPVSIAQLQTQGVLVPCSTFAPPTVTKELAAEPVDAYRERCPGERAFAFCASVPHAERVAASFTAAGFPAACIHADTPADLRRAHLASFRAGRLLVLTNVYALTEGVDVPEASCCILARGCGSASMFLQMVGRVLRAASGKTRATLIDLRGASHIHGLPEEERVYSLHGEAIALKTKKTRKLPSCQRCGAVFPRWRSTPEGHRQCPECHAVTEVEPERVIERPLHEAGGGASRDARMRELNRLALIAASHPEWERPTSWLLARYRAKFNSWPPWGAADKAYRAACAERAQGEVA